VRLPVGSRIVAAMSGGVDSTVTAALLAAAGYDVVGVTLQLYDHGAAIQKKGACCAGQDIHDARTRPKHRHRALRPRLREPLQAAGHRGLRRQLPARRDAIPCIRCNQTVKFRDLLDVARDLAPRPWPPATTSAARSARRPRTAPRRRSANATSPTSCSPPRRTSWPTCASRWAAAEAAVRAAAAELGLAVADKPDSQDICFVPEGRYTTVIDRLRPHGAEPGDIVHLDGRALGRHEGVTR
jgi:tRNA-specific 2-thiouridylase